LKAHKRRQKLHRRLVHKRLSPQARRRRKLLRLIASLTLLSLLIAGGLIAYPHVRNAICTSPYFNISEITYVGLDRVSRQELSDRLPRLTGVNSFTLDLEQLEAQVECHPWVADAQLRRQLPRELIIEIREREPVALLSRSGLWAADASGVILPLDAPRGELNYPVVNLPPGPTPSPGLALAETSIVELLPKLRALQRRLPQLWEMISEVSWDAKGQIELLAFDNAAKVLLGKDMTFQQMLGLYAFLLHEGQRKGISDIECIDLRFWGQVVVKRLPAETDSTRTRAA